MKALHSRAWPIGRTLPAATAAVLSAVAALALLFGESPATAFAQASLVAVGAAAFAAGSRSVRRLDTIDPPLKRQASLLRRGSDLILLVDPSGSIEYRSPSVDSTLGLVDLPAEGVHAGQVIRLVDSPPLMDLLRNVAPGATDQRECLVECDDGRVMTFDAVMTNEIDDPSLHGYVLTMHDVTEWKELEGELTDQALRDGLTGLPNRVLFTDRLENALAARHRPGQAVAVLYLDLDDFKAVNDSLGHVEGDHLLRLAAGRLTSAVRPGDTVARLGGDEFALLFEDIGESQVLTMAARVQAEFAVPFGLTKCSLRIGSSIGIALSSSELASATNVMRAADIALYRAKDAGKGGYAVFEESMHVAGAEGLQLGGDLRGAIEREEIVLAYQPIVDLGTGKITAMEAVVQWPHPERGLLEESQFMPLAERTGLILPLGTLVLNKACRQGRAWQLSTPDTPVRIVVRVSAAQLADPSFVPGVAMALELSSLPAGLLTLEIGEGPAPEDAAAAARRVGQLSALGVGLAMGRFGVGYSSLDAIRQFPIDVVKVDATFVAGIATSRRGLALARAIIRFAHSLKLSTIAEGIETEGQANALRAIGCDEGQGPFFWPPLDAARASTRLAGESAVRVATTYESDELATLTELIDEFTALQPSLKVEVEGGLSTDQLISRLFENDPPEMVISIGTTEFASRAAIDGLADLGPFLKRDRIDSSIFSRITLPLTTSGSKRWALPLLGDAYGLYYNRGYLNELGLFGPPMSISELVAMARALTRRRSDGSLEVVGFNPLVGFYEMDATMLGHAFGVTWFDSAGHSNLSRDGAFSRMLRFQKELIDWYGYPALRQFCDDAGGNFTPANAFETGQLAMVLDGEWRTAFIAAERPELSYGTAPFPVDDSRPDLYGSGYVNCSIVGVPAGAGQKEGGWELAKFLATDESNVVRLANGLRNIPPIDGARRFPDLLRDPRFTVFLEIFAHERSASHPIVPAGAGYEHMIARFVERWQAGEVRNLRSTLRELDRQIDDAMSLVQQQNESVPVNGAAERRHSSRHATALGFQGRV